MKRHFGIIAVLGCLECLPVLASPITALAFSPDGQTLASSGHQRVDLRSGNDGAIRSSIPVRFPRVTSLTFTINGQLVVGGGDPGVRGEACLLELEHSRVLRLFVGGADLVTCVATSPDGQWLALGGANHGASLYSLAPNSSTNGIELVGHSGPVLAVTFAPKSDWLMTASADRSLKTWNLKGELIRSFNFHTEAVHTLAMRPHSESGQIECASGSDDGTVRIWQPVIGRMVRIVRGHGGPIFALAYTPAGSVLFSAGREGILRQLDPDSDQITGQQTAHADVIYSLAVSADGRKLASGDWRGQIKLWDLTNHGTIVPISK